MREEEDSSRHLLLSPSQARLHALGGPLILVPPPLGESGSLATRQLQRDTGDVQGVGAPSGRSEQLCQAWVLGRGVVAGGGRRSRQRKEDGRLGQFIEVGAMCLENASGWERGEEGCGGRLVPGLEVRAGRIGAGSPLKHPGGCGSVEVEKVF